MAFMTAGDPRIRAMPFSGQHDWSMQSAPKFFPQQQGPAPAAPAQPGWWQQMMQRFQGGGGGGGALPLMPQGGGQAPGPQGNSGGGGLVSLLGGGGGAKFGAMLPGDPGGLRGLQPAQQQGLNPMAMGLLGLGGGLMGAAGPSRIPVGLGQGLTQGMMGGLSGMMTANAMNRQGQRDKVIDEILRKQLGIGGQQMAGASDISGPLPQQSMPPPGWNTPQAGGPVMRQPVMPANMPQRGGPIRRYPPEPWNTPQAPLRMAGMPTPGGYY